MYHMRLTGLPQTWSRVHPTARDGINNVIMLRLLVSLLIWSDQHPASDIFNVHGSHYKQACQVECYMIRGAFGWYVSRLHMLSCTPFTQ